MPYFTEEQRETIRRNRRAATSLDIVRHRDRKAVRDAVRQGDWWHASRASLTLRKGE